MDFVRVPGDRQREERDRQTDRTGDGQRQRTGSTGRVKKVDAKTGMDSSDLAYKQTFTS